MATTVTFFASATFTDFIGEDDDEPPFCPRVCPNRRSRRQRCHPSADRLSGHGLREALCRPAAAVHRQARRRRRHVLRDRAADGDAHGYEDSIRIAQLKLIELDEAIRTAADRPTTSGNFGSTNWSTRFPRPSREPMLDVLDRLGWLRKRVSIRSTPGAGWGIRRLKMEAALRRWRPFSVRYAKERVWVERWLHMIDRALTKQPRAARPSSRPRP